VPDPARSARNAKIWSTTTGASPIEASSTRTSLGLVRYARTSDSICCWPPDSCPAGWRSFSPRTGNADVARSGAVASSPLRECSTRFSRRDRRRRRSLAGYKVPRLVVFADSVPRMPNGKIDYPAVQAVLARQLAAAKTTGTSDGRRS
jgi:hypothetical protein